MTDVNSVKNKTKGKAMTFKDFIISYLSPFYLLYRIVFVTISGIMILIGFPMFVQSATGTELIIILISSVFLCYFILKLLNENKIILYYVIPLILFGIAIAFHENQTENRIIWKGIIALNTSSLIIFWNGIRPWGRGISFSQLNNKLNK